MKVWRAIRYAFAASLLPEGRRAWALALMAGGCGVMTVYAAVAMGLVKSNVTYVLYLGLFAHLQILICITGFAGLLVKRTIHAKAFGTEFNSTDQVDQAAEKVATAALSAADEVIQGNKP